MNVVITGTSQGIGLELTKEALARGHRVAAIARASSHLSELQQLGQKNPQALFLIEADLNHPGAVEKIVSELAEWKEIHLLINNAGVYKDDHTPEDFQQSFYLNTIVPFFLSRALMPKLKAVKGKIVNISSQMGSITDNHSGGSHSYRASKAALNMISKGLSQEEKDVTVVVMHPGWVKTRMGGEAAPMNSPDSSQRLWKVIDGLTLKSSGRFLNYDGEELPW